MPTENDRLTPVVTGAGDRHNQGRLRPSVLEELDADVGPARSGLLVLGLQPVDGLHSSVGGVVPCKVGREVSHRSFNSCVS